MCCSPGLRGRGASGAGGRLAWVRPSAFPGQATKRVFWTSLWPWRAWPPYRSGPSVVFGRGPCGAPVRRCGFACPSLSMREQAAGAWRRALLRPPSWAPRSCRGAGGSLPLPRGGWGPAFPWLAGRWGGWGDQGGSRRGSPPPSLGGVASGPLLIPPLAAGVSLPGARVRPGSRGSLPPAGQPGGGGGGGGGAVHEPPLRWGGQGAGGPGGRVASVRRSALPVRATLRASPATLGPWERGPHTAPVCCGAPHPGVARALVLCAGAGPPPDATPAEAGSGGCGGTRHAGSAASPSRASRSFLGEAGRPLGRGGDRGSTPSWPAGRGGVGGAAPLFPSPPPWRAARCPRPCPPPSPAHPPWAYTGCRAVVGAGRGPVGRRPVSAGGRGEVSSLWPAPLPSPGGHQGGPPRLHISGRHRAVAAHGVGAEPPAGSGLCGSERAADRGRLTRG